MPERQPDPGHSEPGDALPLARPTGSRVLLLNATFEPLAVVTAKRAVVLMLTGKAECVEAALEGAFHSECLTIPTPSVMRLSRYVRVPYRRPVPMTRAGILRRDGRRCAYCTRRADTIDHVVPRSRGGTHSWENCVAACRLCNSRKADRLLDELGWSLRMKPIAPAPRPGRDHGAVGRAAPGLGAVARRGCLTKSRSLSPASSRGNVRPPSGDGVGASLIGRRAGGHACVVRTGSAAPVLHCCSPLLWSLSRRRSPSPSPHRASPPALLSRRVTGARR